MTKLESIVVSNTEPNSKNVLWYDNKRLLIFSNGHWSPIVDLDDIDVDNLPNVSNLQEALKSLNIKVDNKVDKVELDAALTAKQDKLVNSADITVGEDDKLSVTEEAKRKLFVDMWTRCYDCKYDATKAKPFTCNGVELTYQEARDVYNAPRIAYPYFTGANQLAVSAKTLILSSRYAPGSNVNLKYAFYNGDYTVIRIASDVDTLWVSNSGRAFGYCQQLEKILGVMRLEMTTSRGIFLQCVKLQEVKINHLSSDISFYHSPLLSLASLTYLVTNAANTSPITITLHPDAYARLTDELIAQATEKQITFATTE